MPYPLKPLYCVNIMVNVILLFIYDVHIGSKITSTSNIRYCGVSRVIGIEVQ